MRHFLRFEPGEGAISRGAITAVQGRDLGWRCAIGNGDVVFRRTIATGIGIDKVDITPETATNQRHAARIGATGAELEIPEAVGVDGGRGVAARCAGGVAARRVMEAPDQSTVSDRRADKIGGRLKGAVWIGPDGVVRSRRGGRHGYCCAGSNRLGNAIDLHIERHGGGYRKSSRLTPGHHALNCFSEQSVDGRWWRKSLSRKFDLRWGHAFERCKCSSNYFGVSGCDR